MLFRLQKYKKFESNSQPYCLCWGRKPRLFRLQKYKKFESNSQHLTAEQIKQARCFDCKSTKNLRAIHNCSSTWYCKARLFRLQKYKKFESNSQRSRCRNCQLESCFDCKSTKNLRAIHNPCCRCVNLTAVVSTAKVQKIWEQFTTMEKYTFVATMLFRLQKYKKFESNSQLTTFSFLPFMVVSTAKVQKIWEQFTTGTQWLNFQRSCFDCKSTKNLRAIHNSSTIPVRIY